MIIEKLTRSERMTISNGMSDIMAQIESAYGLLSEINNNNDMWQTLYAGKPSSIAEVDNLANKLHIVDTLLWDALLSYSLTMGEDDFSGVGPHMKSMEIARNAAKVEALYRRIFKLPNKAVKQKALDISDQPDEKIIPQLEGMLYSTGKEAG